MSRATLLVFGAALLPLACGPTGPFTSSSPYAAPTVDAAAPPPRAMQTGAPGLCGQWEVAPLDLAPLPGPQATASLAARADGRGGITVKSVDKKGTVSALAIAPDGSHDGAPVTLALPPPENDAGPVTQTIVDVVAVPGGWVASVDSSYDRAWIGRFDEGGALASRVVTDGASIDVAADGTIGVVGGKTVGWIRPGASSVDERFTEGGFGGGLVAWENGTFYLASAYPSPSVRSLAPDGTAFSFPAPTFGESDVLVPGATGKSAAVVSPVQGASSSAEGPIAITFVSADEDARAFTFDAEVQRFAAAPRATSDGVVVAWTSSGVTAGGGIAMGLAEVSPAGARSAFVPLGNQVVTAAGITLAGSHDGRTYVAIAWNTSVRSSWLARCVD